MKPIIMSTEDVRALLDGRKTQTRRAVKEDRRGEWAAVNGVRNNSEYGASVPCYLHRETAVDDISRNIMYPKYDVGDILYVRETWQEVYETEYDIYNPNEPLKITDLIVGFDNLPKKCAGLSREWSCSSMPARNKYYVYAASKPEYTDEKHELKWRPSTQMPREAARLFLSVKDVRVERVQESLCNDMLAEGVIPSGVKGGQWQQWQREYFAPLWDSINAKRGHSWGSNPWVWVYTFERITKEEAEHGH